MDETRDCPSIIETKSFIVPDLHTTVISPLKTEVRHLVARLYPDCEKDTSEVVREISELLLEWDFIYSCFSQLQKVRVTFFFCICFSVWTFWMYLYIFNIVLSICERFSYLRETIMTPKLTRLCFGMVLNYMQINASFYFHSSFFR